MYPDRFDTVATALPALTLRAVAGVGGLRHILVQGGRAALDLILPPHCPSCDQAVDEPASFCADCFGRLAFLGEPCCTVCGSSFPSYGLAGSSLVCVSCLASPPSWSEARAALRYDRHSARLILGLKYGDRTELAGVLASHMARAGAELLRGADLLVPVPLHRRRLLARRYNQAGLLATALGRLSGCPVVPDLLERRRHSTSMRGRNANERQEAAEQAFAVRRQRGTLLAGRRVVLVDDVLTTGATAGACTRALLAAGAASVDILAAARAGEEMPDRNRNTETDEEQADTEYRFSPAGEAAAASPGIAAHNQSDVGKTATRLANKEPGEIWVGGRKQRAVRPEHR